LEGGVPLRSIFFAYLTLYIYARTTVLSMRFLCPWPSPPLHARLDTAPVWGLVLKFSLYFHQTRQSLEISQAPSARQSLKFRQTLSRFGRCFIFFQRMHHNCVNFCGSVIISSQFLEFWSTKFCRLYYIQYTSAEFLSSALGEKLLNRGRI
jgi:hypothetical protein